MAQMSSHHFYIFRAEVSNLKRYKFYTDVTKLLSQIPVTEFATGFIRNVTDLSDGREVLS